MVEIKKEECCKCKSPTPPKDLFFFQEKLWCIDCLNEVSERKPKTKRSKKK